MITILTLSFIFCNNILDSISTQSAFLLKINVCVLELLPATNFQDYYFSLSHILKLKTKIGWPTLN